MLSVSHKRLKTRGDRVFEVVASKLCNALPAPSQSADSVDSFKKQLKTPLFRQALGNLYATSQYFMFLLCILLWIVFFPIVFFSFALFNQVTWEVTSSVMISSFFCMLHHAHVKHFVTNVTVNFTYLLPASEDQTCQLRPSR